MYMYSQHSAAIAAPPHRRRRPALACLQCRRRKVKCDQKRPCIQCQRSKDTICTFASDASPTQPHDGRQRPETSQSIGQLSECHVIEDGFRIPTPESSVPTVSTAHSPLSTVTWSLSEPSIVNNQAEFPYLNNNTAVIDGLPKVVPQSSIKGHRRPIFTLYTPDIERHVPLDESMPDLNRHLRPFTLKTKLFGESHWMNDFGQFQKLIALIFESERSGSSTKPSEINILLQKCKIIGRKIKSEHPFKFLVVPDYRNFIPSKGICDELIGNYFRTFESLHRILHIPTFMVGYEKYWTDVNAESNGCSPFMIKLLLVLAIGTTFYRDSDGKPALCSTARQWVYAAQQWTSAPLEKSRMNLGGLQIQCLLILARYTIGIGSDLIWISAGSLLRTAMQLGYHRDPKCFPGMSVLHAEMRRRLWATIMEMGIQASFDSAMPPMISMDDFDTEPPSNFNDADISQNSKTPPPSQPITRHTETTLQIILLRSLRTRLEIARLLTSLPQKISYDEVLRLTSEITASCREIQLTIAGFNQTTPFRSNHINLLTRHLLLHLHRRWAIRARTDPRYYFSRKVCLDTALATVSYTPSPDYTRLLMISNGISRENMALPAMIIGLELIVQLEEEALNPPSALQAGLAKVAREPLIQALRNGSLQLKQRVEDGEVNVKGHLFTAMLLAQIEATEKGENVDVAVAEATIRNLKESLQILESQVGVEIEKNLENQTQSWDENLDEWQGEQVNFNFWQDAGYNFDIPDAGLFGELDSYSWP